MRETVGLAASMSTKALPMPPDAPTTATRMPGSKDLNENVSMAFSVAIRMMSLCGRQYMFLAHDPGSVFLRI